MPIYEYLCESCGHELEAIQKVADPLLTECPACGKSTLKKQLTASAFRLSGSGWYETDFKTGDKKRNLAGGDGDSGGSATNKGSGDEKSGGSDSKAKEKSKSTSGAESK